MNIHFFLQLDKGPLFHAWNKMYEDNGKNKKQICFSIFCLSFLFNASIMIIL